MIKRDEARLLRLIAECEPENGVAFAGRLRAEGRALGVPEKRLYRWAEKWLGRGWWEYGVSLLSGWVPVYEDDYDGRDRLAEVREFLDRHAPPKDPLDDLRALLPEEPRDLPSPPDGLSPEERLRWRVENYSPEEKAESLRRLVSFLDEPEEDRGEDHPVVLIDGDGRAAVVGTLAEFSFDTTRAHRALVEMGKAADRAAEAMRSIRFDDLPPIEMTVRDLQVDREALDRLSAELTLPEVSAAPQEPPARRRDTKPKRPSARERKRKRKRARESRRRNRKR